MESEKKKNSSSHKINFTKEYIDYLNKVYEEDNDKKSKDKD